MSACSVTCRDCGEPPKVWNHGCTDCAQEQLDRHRTDTGHDPQLHIPDEITFEQIQRNIAAVNRVMGSRWSW